MEDRLSGTISSVSGRIKVKLPGPPVDVGSDGRPTESVNLTSVFEPDELSRISARVCDEYDEDVSAREEHMRRCRRWYELYASVMKLKSWPFQNAANVNVPLLIYSMLQVHGRLFDNLLPAKGDYFHMIPTRATDPQEVDRAERTELFMNWYYRKNVPDYRMSYDATFWQLLLFGSTFRGTYWDELENKLKPMWIGIDNMVVPYKCKVTDPTMRGVPRYTLVTDMSLFEIEARADKGEYDADVVATLKPERQNPRDSEFREAVDEADGKTKPSRDFLEDEDRQVLFQHRMLRLPDDPGRHPAFDGKAHPVIVVCDESTKKILKIVLREEDDPADARRFAREDGAYQAYLSAKDAHEAMGGLAPNPVTQALEVVPEPEEVPEPEPPRQREICFFTHYLCFQGEGFYGLGFGNFIAPANEAVNTLINQQIDRSTVNNAGGGIISKQMRFQRGGVDRVPGKYTEVDAPAAVLKDGLVNWPTVPADPDGRWFIQYIEQMVNRTSGAGDTLSGEPVGANETARAAMARNEQAQKQITVLSGRIIGYMTCDAQRDCRLFSVYLDEEEYHDVVDARDQPREVKIGRADFVADANVVPTADSRLSSHAQRVAEAQDFLTMVTDPNGPPEFTQNPALRRAAIEQYLYASDRHEAIQLLGPAPGPPQPPPPKKQWEENADFMKDQDTPVLPEDDDDVHLLEIANFKTEPLGYEKMSEDGRKMLDNHERGHLAQKMVKQRTQHEQQQQALGGALPPAPGGGPGGMAPAPPNGAPPGLSPVGA